MKKLLLLLVTVLSLGISIPTVANNAIDYPTTYIYNGDNKVTFEENGITFSVFQNGEFDFYINRGHVNARVGKVSISYNAGYDYDAYVQYDDYGAIIQIEDTPIYYDRYGRIIQAGDVIVKYQSQRVVRVGGMHIYYNSYGHYSHYTGYINRWNRFYVFNPFHDFFVRPLFNRCIVSLNPYRRYYTPRRYNYWGHQGYKGNRGNKYRNNQRYNARRTFKPVNSRVRSAQSNRVTRRGASTRTSNDIRRVNGQNRVSTRNNSTTRRSTQNNARTRQGTNRVSRSVDNGSQTRRTQTRSNSQRTIKKPTRAVAKPRTQERRVNTRAAVRKPASTSTRSTTQRRSTTSQRSVQSRKPQVKKPVRSAQSNRSQVRRPATNQRRSTQVRKPAQRSQRTATKSRSVQKPTRSATSRGNQDRKRRR